MKAIILAAGKGVRMLPLTEKIPKVLVEINGKPFLHYVIKNLQQAGYNELGIVVGYKKEKIQEFLQQNNIQVTLINQDSQKGTGHAVMQVKQFVQQENFLVCGGDNLFSINDLKSMHIKDNLCHIMGKKIEDTRKYGVLITENNKLIKIIEKPPEFVGNIINVGLYKFTKDIWPALDKIKLSERGEYEITDALSLLAIEKKVDVLTLKDYWLDFGSREDIPIVEAFLTKNF
jgi:dTDP-glucose pyrophosphorylase